MTTNYLCPNCRQSGKESELESGKVTVDDPMGYLCIEWECPNCEAVYAQLIREEHVEPGDDDNDVGLRMM